MSIRKSLIVFTLMLLATATQSAAQRTDVENTAKKKICLIFSEQFSDENKGIPEYIAAVKQVTDSVQPRLDEMRELQKKIQPFLDGKVRDPDDHRAYMDNPPMSTAQKLELKQLVEDFETKKKEWDRTVMELSIRFVEPVSKRVEAAMEKFRIEKGYEKLIDAGCPTCSPEAKGEDVTKEFITYYNKANPVKNPNNR